LKRSLWSMPRLIKAILLSVLIVLVLLAVISRYLPPGMPAHQHGGP
jgi:TRAP-type C4-dicarboxylate transport system permease small subunit